MRVSVRVNAPQLDVLVHTKLVALQHVNGAAHVCGSGKRRQAYTDETVKTHLSVLGALPACRTPRIKCTILLCACLRCVNSDARNLAMPCFR